MGYYMSYPIIVGKLKPDPSQRKARSCYAYSDGQMRLNFFQKNLIYVTSKQRQEKYFGDGIQVNHGMESMLNQNVI